MSTSRKAPAQVGGRRRAPAAFEELVDTHRRELLVHCYRMLGSWTEAEDVFQEVSLRAWRGLPRFEGRASVRSWLYRIATNAYVKAWETGDIEAIVSLLSRDASVAMPPYATWYRGRAAIAHWLTDYAFADGRAFRLRPTFANGRPAFAIYKSGGPCLPGQRGRQAFSAHCIQVLWLAGRHVARIVSFLNPRLVKEFGFGPRLPLGSSERLLARICNPPRPARDRAVRES